MVSLTEIMRFLTDLMGQAGDKDPHMPNGLQVPGRPEIHRLATGVSATLEFFGKAEDWGADALLVHHGINGPVSLEFDALFLQRLRFLLARDLSLIGYHYLLDAHPEVGHAAQILTRLGAELVEPFSDGWGWLGEFPAPRSQAEVDRALTQLLDQEGVRYWFGPPEVRRIAVATGRGTPHAAEMETLRRKGVDLYLTGEPAEWVREMFRELGISFVAGGHYNTERFGLWALGAKIEERFDVQVRFIDVPNPI